MARPARSKAPGPQPPVAGLAATSGAVGLQPKPGSAGPPNPSRILSRRACRAGVWAGFARAAAACAILPARAARSRVSCRDANTSIPSPSRPSGRAWESSQQRGLAGGDLPRGGASVGGWWRGAAETRLRVVGGSGAQCVRVLEGLGFGDCRRRGGAASGAGRLHALAPAQLAKAFVFGKRRRRGRRATETAAAAATGPARRARHSNAKLVKACGLRHCGGVRCRAAEGGRRVRGGLFLFASFPGPSGQNENEHDGECDQELFFLRGHVSIPGRQKAPGLRGCAAARRRLSHRPRFGPRFGPRGREAPSLSSASLRSSRSCSTSSSSFWICW